MEDVWRLFSQVAAFRGVTLPEWWVKLYENPLLPQFVHWQFRPLEWYAEEHPLFAGQPGPFLPIGQDQSGDVYGLFVDPLWPEGRTVVCWWPDTGECAPLCADLRVFLRLVLVNHILLMQMRPEFMTSWDTLRPLAQELGILDADALMERIGEAADFHRYVVSQDAAAPLSLLFLGLLACPGDPFAAKRFVAAEAAAPWYAQVFVRQSGAAREAGDESRALALAWQALNRYLGSWGRHARTGHAAFRDFAAPPPQPHELAQTLAASLAALPPKLRDHPLTTFLGDHGDVYDAEARLELTRELLRRGLYADAAIHGENARFLAGEDRDALFQAVALTLDARTMLGHESQQRVLRRHLELLED